MLTQLQTKNSQCGETVLQHGRRQAVCYTCVAMLGRVRAAIVAVEKAMSVTYCECKCVKFVLKYAMHKCHIVMYSLPHVTIFSPLSHKWQDFRKKSRLLNAKCLF